MTIAGSAGTVVCGRPVHWRYIPQVCESAEDARSKGEVRVGQRGQLWRRVGTRLCRLTQGTRFFFTKTFFIET